MRKKHLTAHIPVTESDVQRVNLFLSKPGQVYAEAYYAQFGEHSIEIRICPGDAGSWAQAFLFRGQKEAARSEMRESFLGSWELEDGDTVYRVVVETA